MKKNFLVLLCFLYFFPSQAQPVLGTDYSYKTSGSDFTFYLFTEFSFGSGSGCPTIDWVQSKKSNDTIYIKAIFDIRGTWAAMGCATYDSILYTNPFSDIHYINVSTNVVKNVIDEFHTDTLWNLYDSTFVLASAGINDPRVASKPLPIYPNPADDYINIDFSKLNGAELLIIFNSMGQAIYQHEGIVPEQINVTMLPGGLYFVRLYNRQRYPLCSGNFYKRN